MASGSRKANNAAEIDRLALALTKEPGSKAFIPLAEEYGKAAMWDEAVAVLEDGLKTYPGFITAMVALGRAYDQLNQPVKAQAILEEAIKLSPDNLRAHRTLAKLYAAQGATDAAIHSCDVILALNPQDQEALGVRAGLNVVGTQETTDAQGIAQEKRTHASVSPSGCEEPVASSTGGAGLSSAGESKGLSRHVVVQEEGIATHEVAIKGPRPEGAQGATNPVVLQLEQWLRFVQTRRRDPQRHSLS